MSLMKDDLLDTTQALWAGFCAGDAVARDRLLALHYNEFRRIARSVLAGDGAKLQIQPTDLAHEAAIRVMRLDRIQVRDRAHFMALSSRIMRQILLDEVRRFRASKRQIPSVETYWGEALERQRAPVFDLEAFDQALDRLMVLDPEKGRIVEDRFYGGLTIEEIAESRGASESTNKRQWRVARAWLLSQLEER
jgi:RNA polymerase sigma factor (TIGR02999 family)